MLAEPLDDPLATEVVAVHSRGIERWIAQELSLRLGVGALGSDGIAANIDFPFPSGLIRRAIAAGSRVDPETDPWLPERLTWPLLELVTADPDAPMLGPLRLHLGGDPQDDRTARRFGAVRHIADLFDRYAVHRPEMLLSWRAGEDVDASLRPLAPRHRWQPELWRALDDVIDEPGLAERRDGALRVLRTEDVDLDLPDRIALFGLTSLPASFLDVLEALATRRRVDLMLLHPSRALWRRIDGRLPLPGPRLPLRADDPTADAARNRLLRSWGRDARELQLVTPRPDHPDQRHDHDPGDDGDGSPDTLLGHLQRDLRLDVDPDARPAPAPSDRSVQVHACHGKVRQVEVLRDAILHLLADDPTLEPRDIIVMCPDIEAFAPLVTAVFGADAVRSEPAGAPPSLRVTLADRSLRRTNPLLDTVEQLLALVDARVTVTDVLDLIGREPVQRRFRFHEDELDTIESWVTALNVRWGFDADHRRRQGLPELEANTWRAGLERLHLGIAMADEDLREIGGVVPFDQVEGGASELAGRLTELIARLETTLERLRGPMPVADWRDAIDAAVETFTVTTDEDAWQRRQLDGLLDDIVGEATHDDAPSGVELVLGEVRALLSQRLEGRPSRTSHRTGDLTVCTLVPMRSVPHRVVCLLGMDDGAFPRRTVPDADDLLLDAPRVGDRDPRSEDRQLLLDAVLAATDTLLVTYAGRDVRNNEPRPPAVPVDELLDAIERTAPGADVITHHPLTSHDPRNFLPDGSGPWGFQPDALAAAEARRAPARPAPPFLSARLDPVPEDVIDLDDLVAFLEHPVRAFFRQTLDVRLPSEEERTPTAIPSTLAGLEAWAVGDQVLRAWLAGSDPERALAVARARGITPPGELAERGLARIRETVGWITGLCTDPRVDVPPGARRAARDVEVELADGRLVTGTVPMVRDRQLESVSYGKIKPKHRLATWARLLALTASNPDVGWQAVTVGKHSWGRPSAEAFTIAPLDRDHAAVQLTTLVDLYDRGRREPLPLYCETSAKIAENVRSGRYAPMRYVDKAWETDGFNGFDREDRDPYHLAALGRALTTQELFDIPCEDDTERSWWTGDDVRVVSYAWRLWEPLLRAERRR